MRSKCMGMLHEFDLDFVMHANVKWAVMPRLPGLAIYSFPRGGR